MAVVCRQSYFVSCQGASEEITRPHGGREMSRISAIDAGFEASEYGRSVEDMLSSEPSHDDSATSVSGREREVTIRSIMHSIYGTSLDAIVIVQTMSWRLHGLNGLSDCARNFRNHDATPSDFVLALASARILGPTQPNTSTTAT
jgi:hypothetical protein